MKQVALLSLLIVLRFSISAQTIAEKCTFENARTWLTRPPVDYELAFTQAWPGREAKFPPKNYYFVAYRGNHLLIKSTGNIAFNSQSVSNTIPQQCAIMGKNGNVFWVLNERDGKSEVLVWTNRLALSELSNEVLNTYRSSTEAIQLVRNLGIQTMPIERLLWEGIHFSYSAETNGAFLRGTGNFTSNQDGSVKNAVYSYERSDSPGDTPKRLAFDVNYSGTVASSSYILPQQFSVWASLKDRKPFVAYTMNISHFSTVSPPASHGLFEYATYTTSEKTKLFYISGTNLFSLTSSGQPRAVIQDPNAPQIIRQKNTANSKSLYFISAALLGCFPLAFMAIKLWNKRKTQ